MARRLAIFSFIYQLTHSQCFPTLSLLKHCSIFAYEKSSIVAVHGLGGGTFSTWTHPETKTLWLRDLLPSTMKHSRIMSYGYDAAVYKSQSTLRILDHAEDLLFSIAAMRRTEMVGMRRGLHSASLTISRLVVGR